MRFRLRNRLFILTSVAFAPALVLLVVNVFSLRQSREREVHADALQVGNLAAVEMDRIFAGAKGLLGAIAAAPIVKNFEAGCDVYLKDIVRQNPQYSTIVAFDVRGVSRCRLPSDTTDVTFEDRPYFKEIMAGADFVIAGYTTGKLRNTQFLPVAAPIPDSDGKTVGVLMGAFQLPWLQAAIEQRQLPTNDALTIADRSGVILARHPFSDRFVGTVIPDEFQKLVRAETSGTLEVKSQDGTRRIIGYVPPAANHSGFYISAGIGREAAFAPINAATGQGVMVIGIGAIIAFLAAMLTGRTLITRPVRELITAIELWRQGDVNARTQMKPDAGELETVGFAIDRFMDDLERHRKRQQKAEETRELLMREMEHRVKNVFATVQAIASQTLRREAIPQSALDNFFGRLQAMSNAHRLLLDENRQSAKMRDVIETASKPFDRKRSRFQLSGPDVAVNAKAAWALSMAIHELCTNATKFGALKADEGHIAADWSVSADGSFALDWVEQNGPAVVVPLKTGFGSLMIRRVLASELNADITIDYDPAGFRCRVEAPAPAVLAEAAEPARMAG